MKERFILEFNEQQQCFHYNHYNEKTKSYGSEPKSYGWITVIHNCNYEIAENFLKYIDWKNIRKIGIVSKDYILDAEEKFNPYEIY